jgi:hypothetical protein
MQAYKKGDDSWIGQKFQQNKHTSQRIYNVTNGRQSR